MKLNKDVICKKCLTKLFRGQSKDYMWKRGRDNECPFIVFSYNVLTPEDRTEGDKSCVADEENCSFFLEHIVSRET